MLRSRITIVGLLFLSSTGAIGQTNEVVVDNRDENTSQIGTWWSSSGQSPYMGNSIYNKDRYGSFTWYPELPEPGDYDVYAWWTYYPTRSSNVPFLISQDTVSVKVFVDMLDEDLAGKWNLLGRFTYSEGTAPEISVLGENGQANADAVRFVLRVAESAGPDGPCYDNFNRYVDCGNGTVTDTVTGLIWTKDAGCIPPTNFAGVHAAAASLEHGKCGLTDNSRPGDWRIPSQAEWVATVAAAFQLNCTLQSSGIIPNLTDRTGRVCFSLGQKQFDNVDAAGTALYWSATAVPDDPRNAYNWLTNGSTNGSTRKVNTIQGWALRR